MEPLLWIVFAASMVGLVALLIRDVRHRGEDDRGLFELFANPPAATKTLRFTILGVAIGSLILLGSIDQDVRAQLT